VSLLAIVTVLIGLLIVLLRAPLVIAPRATLDGYQRLIQSTPALRGVGAVFGLLGVLLILLTPGEGAAPVLIVLGWILALAALWLLASPASYRRLAIGMLDFFRNSADSAVTRGMGLLGVGIGVGLVYVGLFVL
jgi:hypothetical protein